jgi:hypothetical protein
MREATGSEARGIGLTIASTPADHSASKFSIAITLTEATDPGFAIN